MTEPETAEQDATQNEVSARTVAEHLNSLLLSADSTAQRIVRDAEARAQEQLEEVDRRIRRMEAEAVRLSSWKQETDHMIQGLATAIGEFSRDVSQIPQRIDEALGPLAAHVPVMVRQIDELRAALGMPAPAEPPVAAAFEPPDSNGDGHPTPATDGPQPGEIQLGWLPGWEDLEEGAH